MLCLERQRSGPGFAFLSDIETALSARWIPVTSPNGLEGQNLRPCHSFWTKTEPSTAHTLEPIILQIISFSSRWPEVDLRLRNDGLVAEPFRSGLRNRLPLLQTLRLKSNSNVPRVVDAFEHAPNLHTVILDGVQPTSILLPWGQLTHFTGETLREQDCSHVLRSAVSLVECKFLEADGEVDPELLPPHRNLEVLHLTGHMLCAHILCILTLPALLELKFDDGNDNECHEEFSQFLSRSQPPLHRLSLYRGYQLLVHGFPLLPHLAVLEIDLSIAEMSDLLRKFRDFDAAVFLPNLRSVVVSIQEPNSYGWNLTKTAPIDYGDLADALEHRWNRNNAGPRLTSLRMSQFFADNYDEEAVADKLRLIPPSDFRMHLPRLLELVKEGMQIAVTVTVVSLPPAMWI
ncbi:hypothetical protein DFH06DRAFT_513498 [Mycena polygramma]|nr:hypothetical protein DFH06DRAFT_513498 [Mycena polygramma]